MSAANWLLSTLLFLPVLFTLLPLVKHNHWAFRIFDFPRPQIAVLNFACLIVQLILQPAPTALFLPLALANLICFIYQLKEVRAYTRLAKPEVIHYQGSDNQRTLSLLTSNVLTPNRRADLLLEQIHRYAPDVVLTLESDAWWEQ